MSHARNVGMDRARGEWLTFVDADDRLEPNHLQLLVDATKNGEPEIVVGGWKSHHALRAGLHEVPACESDRISLSKGQLVSLPYDVLCFVWCQMYSTSFLRACGARFNEAYAYGEDALFSYQCLLAAERVNAIRLGGYIHVTDLAKSNACSKYWPYKEEVQRQQMDLACQLAKAGGHPAEAIATLRSERLCQYTHHWVSNLFLQGCPLSFREKVRELRRILFSDSDAMEAVERHSEPPHTIILRVRAICFRLRSPWLMVVCVQALLRPQGAWRKLKARFMR